MLFEDPKNWYLVSAAIVFLVMMLPLITKYSKNEFWCNTMQWHTKPENISNAGVSDCGICPRCQKRVLKDSQGNWFRAVIK